MDEQIKYIVTARKWRPQTFADVVGQEHITTTMKNAILSNRIAHAYLFAGPRGVGKTTTARILAKVLNCLNPKNGEPCNECEMCQSFANSQSLDIIEIDGASNRRIEEIRTLRESVKYAPTKGNYKVYIIDEVHMLTTESFNALLKTLEEPPEHTIFIFATTDVHKVPLTIISRCQSFVFKKPNDAILSQVVINVAKKEGYKLEEGGAELIALLADGAFRDALGTLQKVISFSQDKVININEIELITGAPNTTLVDSFLDALAENDVDKGFASIEKAVNQNIDMSVYIKMILYKLRYALMLRYVPSTKKSIEAVISERDMNYLIKLISTKPEHISSSTLSILLEAYQSLRTAVISELPLELALIKILNVEK